MREYAIFDLNKEKFTYTKQIPTWPIKLIEPIHKSINHIIDTANKLKFSNKNHSEHDEMQKHWAISSLLLRKIFFETFIKLMGNYPKYFKAGSYNYEKYMNSIDPQYRTFMEHVVKTRQFKTLVEKTYKNELMLFIEGIRIYESKGEGVLEQEVNKLVNTSIENYNNVFYNIKVAFVDSFREVL
jgi:hypothetical protein